MVASQNLSSLACEMRIIRAKNVDFISTGNIFIRYYLSAGNNKRIQLNSREISPKSDPHWNESICLECSGTQNSLEELKQQRIVFELRWRNTAPILGRIGGSKLLGRAEVAWKDVLESSELAIEKWVTMASTSRRALEGQKPPALQIGMRVRATEASDLCKRRELRSKKWDECGCRHGSCHGGAESSDDIFALAAAIEAL